MQILYGIIITIDAFISPVKECINSLREDHSVNWIEQHMKLWNNCVVCMKLTRIKAVWKTKSYIDQLCLDNVVRSITGAIADRERERLCCWCSKTCLPLYPICWKPACSMSNTLPKTFERYVVHMISGQYLGVARFFENIASESSSLQYNLRKNCMLSILCSFGKV